MPVINDRRDFIRKLGLAGIPLLLPYTDLHAASALPAGNPTAEQEDFMVNFAMDGLFFSPAGYIEKLREINAKKEIPEDTYFEGGSTAALEKKFAEITGKEKAIYLPTGTMANQVAIKLLSKEHAKILVPENSHIYRDEADAAQRINHKRLIPYGDGESVALLDDLKKAEAHTLKGEVFQSGLNTVVVECPVRRAQGAVVPFGELEAMASYCREKGYKMHLDGARLHLASAYSGITAAEYASLFDTVYISLYKYLNAGGGAILCGEASVIDQVKDEMKVLGGTMWQSWYNTAMALEYLEDIDARWAKLIEKGEDLIERLNQLDGINISALQGGTNIFKMETGNKEKGDKLVTNLVVKDQIYLRSPDENGNLWFYMNESTAAISNEALELAFRQAWKKAHDE